MGDGGVTETVDNVSGFEHGTGGGTNYQAGVVVDDVEDLDIGAVRQGPVGSVELPALVGLVRFEADIGALGAFVRLGSDEPPLDQDPPDRGDRRAVTVTPFEVKRDGRRAGVMAGLVEVFADGNDLVLDLPVGPVR